MPLSGTCTLPRGEVVIDREIVIPAAARDLELRGQGTLLRAAPDFNGRALIVVEGAQRVWIRDLEIAGNRAALEQRLDLPPYDRKFARHFKGNGILAVGVRGLRVEGVKMSEVAGFAILVSRSREVRLRRLAVRDSGSRNARGRNNTSGGILLEDGTEDFEVGDSEFSRILGNGIWMHSRYESPRNSDGRIESNRFEEIGRDAIQVGHATRIRVSFNTGKRIGYPVEAVDAEGGGTPVGIDTAGNVDHSVYHGNRFEEINGKCIDLDGFHHGAVEANTCINRGAAADYAFGHFAIVMNNTNPDMQSEGIRITGNTIDGTKFGGIFVIGSGNRIEGNRMKRLNLAGCNESAAKFGCAHFAGEPDLMQAGIYLGRGAERPAPARGNRIAGNEISGHEMERRCVLAAPGIAPADNQVEGNICRKEGSR